MPKDADRGQQEKHRPQHSHDMPGLDELRLPRSNRLGYTQQARAIMTLLAPARLPSRPRQPRLLDRAGQPEPEYAEGTASPAEDCILTSRPGMIPRTMVRQPPLSARSPDLNGPRPLAHPSQNRPTAVRVHRRVRRALPIRGPPAGGDEAGARAGS